MNKTSTTGNSGVLEDLRRGFHAGRLSHAYLLAGTVRGVAQEVALGLLSTVLGNPPEDSDFDSLFRKYAENRHHDIAWVEPTGKGRMIQIGQIRELNKRMFRTTLDGGWKAGVFLYAECFNPPAANAFLKTLEEPSPKTLLLLLSQEPQHLLPTIISRCQRISLHEPTSAPHDEPWLENVLSILREGPPDDPLSALSRAARLSGLLKAMTAQYQKEEVAAYKGEELDDDVIDARVKTRLKELLESVLRSIQYWHRDVLMCVVGADPSTFHFGRDEQTLRGLAGGQRYGSAIQNIQAVDQALDRLQRNVETQAVFEGMFIAQGRASHNPA